MAKNTSRDKIWTSAIDLRDDLAEPDSTPLASYVGSFRVPEVKDWLERHDHDVPSDRTITDTLESMAEAGVVERRTSGGHGKWARYEPPESMKWDDPDECQVCGESFGVTGSDRTDVTTWHRDEHIKETLHLCPDCADAYPDLDDRKDLNRRTTE